MEYKTGIYDTKESWLGSETNRIINDLDKYLDSYEWSIPEWARGPVRRTIDSLKSLLADIEKILPKQMEPPTKDELEFWKEGLKEEAIGSYVNRTGWHRGEAESLFKFYETKSS